VITLRNGLIVGFRWEQGLKGCEDLSIEGGNASYLMKQTFQDFVTAKETTTDNKYCSVPFCADKTPEACQLKVITKGFFLSNIDLRIVGGHRRKQPLHGQCSKQT